MGYKFFFIFIYINCSKHALDTKNFIINTCSYLKGEKKGYKIKLNSPQTLDKRRKGKKPLKAQE